MAKLYSVSVNDLKISLLAVNFLLVSENVEHFLPKPAFLLQRVSRLGQGLGSAATHLRIFWLEVFEEWGLLFKILNLQQNIHQSGSSEIMNQKLLSHKPFKQLLEKKIFYFWTVTKSREREYVMCDVCLLTPLLCDHTCGSVTPAPSPGSCSAGLKLPLSPPPRPVWAPGRWQHKLLPEKGETENQQHYLSQIHRPRTSVGKKRIKLTSTVINYVIFIKYLHIIAI